MKDFDFIKFHDNVQKDLAEASLLVSAIEFFEWNEMQDTRSRNSYEIDEEHELNKLRLIEMLDSIRLKLLFAYEYLGLAKMMEKLEKELTGYTGKYAKLDYIPYVDALISPVKGILLKHLNSLTSHVKTESKGEFEHTYAAGLLEQMLRGTPKILFDRGLEPKNEAEVRNEVYRLLIHVFPDTVREIPISKVSKVYKPDVGVKKLKSAIEYKFVDTEAEAKTAIDGIFQDIQGYEGSEDWTTFYAVVYMTNNFMTQAQVEAEFKLSKVPHHWKPIVVFGKGQGKQKRKKLQKRRVLNSKLIRNKTYVHLFG